MEKGWGSKTLNSGNTIELDLFACYLSKLAIHFWNAVIGISNIRYMCIIKCIMI